MQQTAVSSFSRAVAWRSNASKHSHTVIDIGRGATAVEQGEKAGGLGGAWRGQLDEFDVSRTICLLPFVLLHHTNTCTSHCNRRR